MLIVLSPAKTLDFTNANQLESFSEPVFIKEAAVLIKELRKLKAANLSSLMGISARLADLNFERYIRWDKIHNQQVAKQAIMAFKGEVYIGLNAEKLDKSTLEYINRNVRVLSGLYGILKPFDLIREYRLEMGTKLSNPKGKNLYDFWGKKIAQKVNEAIEESEGEKVLVNLASEEYFKSVDKKTVKFPVITPVFKDFKDDKYVVISFFAKKARGMMTRYIALNKIQKVEEMKLFNLGGYSYNPDLSKKNEWVFTR